MPSDHLILDEKPLKKAIDSAMPLAQAKKLVTFGIEPKNPETGFGYIKMGTPFLNGFEVEKFTEKPEESTAESYLEDGSYLWNTGIFLFRADVFLKAVEKQSARGIVLCLEPIEVVTSKHIEVMILSAINLNMTTYRMYTMFFFVLINFALNLLSFCGKSA